MVRVLKKGYAIPFMEPLLISLAPILSRDSERFRALITMGTGMAEEGVSESFFIRHGLLQSYVHYSGHLAIRDW